MRSPLLPVAAVAAATLVAAAVFGLVAGCGSCATTAAPEDSTLKVGRNVEAIGLDPARITDNESAEVCEQIYDHLTRFRRDSMEVEPALASSWEHSDNGKEWTFHLRRDVVFHDGTRFDADAVVFSFDRQHDPHHPYHHPDFNYWEATFRNIERVEKVDDFTVRIIIERSYAPFLANLSTFPVAIVSPTAVKRWGDEYPRHPVGTGPFRFVEWSPGERITLEANSRYWDGPPHLKRLVFTVVPQRQRLVALEGGAIDIAESLAPDDLQFVQLHPELAIQRVDGFNVSYLAMNTDHEPFKDPRVRQAINHAINRRPIVKLVYQGLATEARGALPPSAWGYIDVQGYSYDPAKAKALLAEAHYDHSLRPKLYVATTSVLMPNPPQVAHILQRYMHEVGVEVEVVVNPIREHLRATSNSEHDLCILGWSGDNGDPDNFLYILFDNDSAQKGTATNVAFLRDGQLHGKLIWARETTEKHERERIYAEAQHIIDRLAPWVPLAHTQVVLALHKRVKSLHVHPSAMTYYRDVSVEHR